MPSYRIRSGITLLSKSTPAKRALVSVLKDGEWHTLPDLIDLVRGTIPPETLIHLVGKERLKSGRQKLQDLYEIGLREWVNRTLRSGQFTSEGSFLKRKWRMISHSERVELEVLRQAQLEERRRRAATPQRIKETKETHNV